MLVTAMMAVLFRPGAFTGQGAADVGSAQIVFWVAFAGFFFGLTYGLLQIVGEQAIFRREHLGRLTGTLPALRAYGDTFSGTVVYRWLVLAGFAGVFALATVQVLRRWSRPGRRGRR